MAEVPVAQHQPTRADLVSIVNKAANYHARSIVIGVVQIDREALHFVRQIYRHIDGTAGSDKELGLRRMVYRKRGVLDVQPILDNPLTKEPCLRDSLANDPLVSNPVTWV